MVSKKSKDKLGVTSAKLSPGTSLDAHEKKMISLATDLAEKQLREGTASSQIITHYLKLGSTKEKIEKEILEEQKKLLIAKTEAIQDSKSSASMYEDAINAMKGYKSSAPDEDYYDEY